MQKLKRPTDRDVLATDRNSASAHQDEPLAISPHAALKKSGARTAGDILSLQQTIGNRAVRRLVAGSSPRVPPVQAKLTVGSAGDHHEQEADRVAHEVVRTLDAPGKSAPRVAGRKGADVQRKPLPAISPLVQRGVSAGPAAGEVDAKTEAALEGARGGGQSLPEQVREPMERAFGEDFGNVRVHADQQADSLTRALGARAFTTGNDLFFKRGEYAPESPGGQEVMAHELTHVVQQRGGGGGGGTIQRTIDGLDKQTEWFKELKDDEKELVEIWEKDDEERTLAQVKAALGKEWDSGPRSRVAEFLEQVYDQQKEYKYTGTDANLVAWALVSISRVARNLSPEDQKLAHGAMNYFLDQKEPTCAARYRPIQRVLDAAKDIHNPEQWPGHDAWNCWSMVIYAMYKAGEIDRPGMVEIYKEMRTQEDTDETKRKGGFLSESGSSTSAAQLTVTARLSDTGGQTYLFEEKGKKGKTLSNPTTRQIEALVKESGVHAGDVVVYSMGGAAMGSIYGHVGVMGKVDSKPVVLHLYDRQLKDVRTGKSKDMPENKLGTPVTPVQATGVGEFIAAFQPTREHKTRTFRFLRPDLSPYKAEDEST